MTKKRVAIITFTYGVNFGCYLQRYALQTVLSSLGYQPEAIRFTPKDPTRSRTGKSLTDIPRLLKRVGRSGLNRFLDPGKLRTRRFQEFSDRFLLSSPRFLTIEDLSQFVEDHALTGYDAFIAGSDQIWNVNRMPSEDYYRFYMADFAPAGKKISYAASLGVSEIPSDKIPKFQKYLADFSWISVREEAGASALESILHRPIDVVLDPTTLLKRSDWESLTASSPIHRSLPPSYVLCYSLKNKKENSRRVDP